jgi:hypothetical protein
MSRLGYEQLDRFLLAVGLFQLWQFWPWRRRACLLVAVDWKWRGETTVLATTTENHTTDIGNWWKRAAMIARGSIALAVLLPGLVSVASTRAQAAVMYTYTGTNFNYAEPPYKKTDSMSGSLILTAPLPDSFSGTVDPVSFTFTDGVDTFTQDTVSSYRFYFFTDAAGALESKWLVDIVGSRVELFSNVVSATSGSDAVIYTANNQVPASSPQSHPGTWAVTSVPEPNTLCLVASGLLGLAPVGRQRQSRKNRNRLG